MIKKIARFFDTNEDELLEFDRRYPVGKAKRKADDLFNSCLSSSKQVIHTLNSRKRPKAMEEFDRLFITDERLKELESLKKSGARIVGTFCNMVPVELIYAAGCIPIRLCSGCNEAVKSAEEIFPRDSCSLVKASIGFVVQDHALASICDVIVIPATCDAKKKMGEILDEYKPVWMMELPQTKDRTVAKKAWLCETNILKNRLEELTKTKITKKKLEGAIRLTHRRHDATRRLLDKRKSAAISGCDSMLVMNAAFFDDIGAWTEKTEKLCNEIEETNQEGNPVRILLTGSPIIMPNFKIPLTFEHFNSIIASDLTCAGTQQLYDPVEVDEWNMEDMMKAISERCLLPSLCPCFIKGEDRIDTLLERIESYRIEGVVYHCTRLCLLFDAESAKIKKAMENNGIPFLYINTDYSKEDTGQLKTRIEAFIEILESRRRK